MKTSLLPLQCAVEKNGSARMWVYPPPDSVSPTGGLASAFWPRDPWTGSRLTPGATRGHYAYVRAKDYRSYRLTGYLSGGRIFVVTGGMTHTPMLAYDHRGKEVGSATCSRRATRGTTRRWSSAPTGAPSATCAPTTARRSP